MAVAGSGGIDGATQVKILDDRGGAQIKDLVDRLQDLFFGDGGGTEGIYRNRDGAGNADGVGQFYFTLFSQPGLDDVFGNVAGGVGGGAVDLGGVLTGEGTATVAAVTTVGIDDDLPAGEAAITLGTADNEAAGGVDIEFSIDQ